MEAPQSAPSLAISYTRLTSTGNGWIWTIQARADLYTRQTATITCPRQSVGYWADHIYGLWFQPIQEDMQIRIGYPLNGQAGGSVGNFVNYTLIGNPDAPRPDVTDQEDIPIGTPSDTAIEGMNLIWQDEFNGTTLDNSKWNYETGYYLNDDPNTWGWGNSEAATLYQ